MSLGGGGSTNPLNHRPRSQSYLKVFFSVTMLPPKPKPRNWVHEYHAMRILPFKELHEAVDRLKAESDAWVGEPIPVHPLKSKREYFPGFPVDDDNPSDGRDLCLALDEATRRSGAPRSDVRPDRPDPPVMQTPPEYVLRYPTPPRMRAIKALRLSQENGGSACPPDYSKDIRPVIGSSIWPKSFDAVVPVPLTIRCQPIRGLEWGADGIDKETPYKRHHGGNDKCWQRSLPNS